MNIVSIARIVIALLKIVEIITSSINQEQWRKLGYAQAVNESLARIATNIKLAKEAHADAEKKTDTQLDDVLKS